MFREKGWEMKPILFSDEMVRSILDGRKTQTRRPVKPQPKTLICDNEEKTIVSIIPPSSECPFGQVGDRLWVKETFCLENQVEGDQPPPFNDGRPTLYLMDSIECAKEDAEIWIQPHYRATDPTPELSYEDTDGEPTVKWKPSIHMPRWASRITLEIVDVRIERVQEITEEEAIEEGAREFPDLPSIYPYNQDPRWSMEDPKTTLACLGSPRWAFANLWEKMYANKGFGWYENPWVWVITFRRKNEI